LWYFPAGIPHSIQGLEEGCEFLLVFDDGNFSELSTFTITNWFAHTPKDVLAENFGVPESAFAHIPTKQRFIFQTKVPGSTPGGKVRIVDSTNFPISTRIAAVLVEIKPGGMRELHWHPNNDEWQYYLSGTGRMTIFASSGTARTFNYRAGDVGYVPFGMGHYVQNTGHQSLWFLEMFKSNRYADVSLNQWMALTPKELVQDHLNVGPELVNALRKEKWPVVKSTGIVPKLPGHE
jgi:oxalate decarboxylase